MPLAGKWEFPGGKVERGERPERALAREIREELDLEIEVHGCLGRSEVWEGDRGVELDVYAARAASHAPTLHEHSEIRWVGSQELHALDWATADIPILPAVAARLDAHPDSVSCPEPFEIVSVDWSSNPLRRAAYVARWRDRWRISQEKPPSGGWTLTALLVLAEKLSDESGRRALLGIDAVLGVPALFARAIGARTFFDALRRLERCDGLKQECAAAPSWSQEAPFFRVPAGRGSLTAFVRRAGGRSAVLRQIEMRTAAKTVFSLSGIPGTVGSGSRALWGELAPLLAAGQRSFRVWPFEGDLHGARSASVIVAEVYPRASYAIALADDWPRKPLAIGKTRRARRVDALRRLGGARWIPEHGVAMAGLEAAESNEDDFDALLTAAALVRHFAERTPLSCWLVDPLVEGGILGTGLLEMRPAPRRRLLRNKKPRW